MKCNHENDRNEKIDGWIRFALIFHGGLSSPNIGISGLNYETTRNNSKLLDAFVMRDFSLHTYKLYRPTLHLTNSVRFDLV